MGGVSCLWKLISIVPRFLVKQAVGARQVLWRNRMSLLPGLYLLLSLSSRETLFHLSEYFLLKGRAIDQVVRVRDIIDGLVSACKIGRHSGGEAWVRKGEGFLSSLEN